MSSVAAAAAPVFFVFLEAGSECTADIPSLFFVAAAAVGAAVGAAVDAAVVACDGSDCNGFE